MSYRENFIAALVWLRRREYHPSTRGAITPEELRELEDEAEKAMAKIERAAAEAAWNEGAKAQWAYGPYSIPNEYRKNPYRREETE